MPLKIRINENQLKKILYALNEDSLPSLTILWLDDIRDPNKYFSKERLTSGAWVRNNDYYSNNIFNRYNVNFVWVKNIDEFKSYIVNNGLPEFISFDHDLRPKGYVGDFSNGSDCATWLVNYCNENNLSLPRCFIHSANKNGIKNISSILGI